jgi:hypothetical protein
MECWSSDIEQNMIIHNLDNAQKLLSL